MLPNRASNKPLCGPCVSKAQSIWNTQILKSTCSKYPSACYPQPDNTLQPAQYACRYLKQLPTTPARWCFPPLGCKYKHPHGDLLLSNIILSAMNLQRRPGFSTVDCILLQSGLALRLKSYIILIKPKMKIFILNLMKIYNLYRHSGNGIN